MRTIALFFCVIMIFYGLRLMHTQPYRIIEGSIMVLAGSLAAVIIGTKTKKIKGYNPNDFMNK